jgi:hypothetical protein
MLLSNSTECTCAPAARPFPCAQQHPDRCTAAPHSAVASFVNLFPDTCIAPPHMALTDFNTLTFDVIGTLIDFEAGILQWMRPRLQAAKTDMTDDAILQVNLHPSR